MSRTTDRRAATRRLRTIFASGAERTPAGHLCAGPPQRIADEFGLSRRTVMDLQTATGLRRHRDFGPGISEDQIARRTAELAAVGRPDLPLLRSGHGMWEAM